MLSHLAYLSFDDMHKSFRSKANNGQSCIKVKILKSKERKKVQRDISNDRQLIRLIGQSYFSFFSPSLFTAVAINTRIALPNKKR